MLKFQPFSKESLKIIQPYIGMNTAHNSDMSIGFIFMWHMKDSRYCIHNDTLVIHQRLGGQSIFTWPVGKDIDGMLDELLIYTRENKLPMRFYPVSEEIVETIKKDSRFGNVLGDYDRKWSDYIYSFEEAAEFKGRKFSGQRNHINKFRSLYGEPEIRLITDEDMPAVRELLDKYSAEHDGGNKMEVLEMKHTRQLLENYKELGMYAACMTIDEEIAALSIGEIAGDMLIIHIEKALKKYRGIYPTMYNGFVRLIAEHLGYPLELVNREDDSGDIGLRTSKMQYQPTALIHKYLVNTNFPDIKPGKYPVLTEGDVVLTEIRDTDKAAYLRLNTDIENNRYWGYDYREDVTIMGEITEDTFYDSVMHDMLVGDSVNFAVRTSVDGDMIGEGIIWNFANDGTAEIGCRIFPEYQGRGIGKTAFGVLCDYAETQLGLSIWARSFIHNKASCGMICANGFHEVRTDGELVYFERSND